MRGYRAPSWKRAFLEPFLGFFFPARPGTAREGWAGAVVTGSGVGSCRVAGLVGE